MCKAKILEMKVRGFVGDKQAKSGYVEQILRLLNGRPLHPAANVLLSGTEDGIDDRDAPLARFLLETTLRRLVDTWIETGKAGAGENVSDRTFRSELLQDYLNRNPPSVELRADGPCLLVYPQVWGEQRKLCPFAEDAANKTFSHMERLSVRDKKSLRRMLAFAWDTAIALMLVLLDSPECKRLFRCDGCGTYFMRQRMPKKDTPIKRGSWCASCKRDGRDRVQRTKESRDQRTDRRIELAADAWPRWKPDRRHGERAEWVAEQVNKKLPANANHIAKNWVTRHQNEIEAEVEGRKHAKG